MTPATENDPAARRAALAMIEQGNALRRQGRIAQAMARYDAAVRADPGCAHAHLARGNLLLASTRVDEARSAYQMAIACDPLYAAAHFNMGNLNYRTADFASALRNYQATASITPRYADAFVGMANALQGLGRTADAWDGYQRALAINPDHPEAHFNLGVLAMTQERLTEAAQSLRRAIELRPDNPLAHRFLGAALNNLGNREGAEASLRRALSLAPDAPDILYDLAILLQFRGAYTEAVPLLARALIRAPNWATKVAFANCAGQTRFASADPVVRAMLVTAIRQGWGMPQHLSRAALGLIMLDERIARCVRLANESWPARLPRAALFGTDGLAACATDPLLQALLESVPLSSIEFERFLTCARHALLEIASSTQAPALTDVSALAFYAALARQCFINEYVYDCPDSERHAQAACRSRLLALLDSGGAAADFLVLAAAAYAPLHQLPEPGRLLGSGGPGPVDEVLRQQIREPLEERALRAGIQSLTPISDAVSAAVRDQYEENPYPRWARVQRREETLSFNAELRRAIPFAQFSPLADDSAPEMLIAGCGTGRDAIQFAQRFGGVRVLAIDLSLGSISYALRKARELGITNIAHAQADILKLGSIGRTFDLIGSVGVLHHLADPFEGWRVLLSCLRPGGLMFLGLYSQTARRIVARAREFVAARGYGSTSEAIRQFRQDVLTLNERDEVRQLTKSHAFFSMSDCRDLAFHVQEHHLTLAQIDSFLSENGLRFLGFELNLRVLNAYRARFRDDPSCTSLRYWARFEADNPDTFTGMYQFWVQR